MKTYHGRKEIFERLITGRDLTKSKFDVKYSKIPSKTKVYDEVTIEEFNDDFITTINEAGEYKRFTIDKIIYIEEV